MKRGKRTRKRRKIGEWIENEEEEGRNNEEGNFKWRRSYKITSQDITVFIQNYVCHENI